jgi:hypothetical protein
MNPNFGYSPAPFEGALELSTFANNVIEFKGAKYVPDETKGYFTFAISHSFPVSTFYGTALHPNVIAQSYNSMLHQNLNFEHNIRAYHKSKGDKNYVEDRVIGSIVAVDFPAGMGTLRAGKEPVAIKGVAVYYKMTTGMQKVVGEHQTSRHRYTVSMEVQYPYDDSGLAIASAGAKPMDTTPADLAAMGYDYVPWSAASEELRGTFSKEKNRIVKKYQGRETFMLMGGVNGTVHYAGIGLVKYGAEPTAEITQMAASATGEVEKFQPILSLGDLIEEAAKKILKKNS